MPRRLRRFLEGGELTATLIRVATGSAVLQFVNLGAGLATGIALSRLLGVNGIGQYGLAMATASFLGIAIEAGMSQVILRNVAREQRLASNTLAAIKEGVVSVVGVGVLISFAVTGYAFLRPAPVLPLLVSLLFCVVVGFTNIVVAPVLGSQKVVAGQLPSLVVRPLVFLFCLGLLTLNKELVSPLVAMISQVIAATAALLIGCLQLSALWPPSEPHGHGREPQRGRWRLWLDSLPIAASEAARIIQGNAAIAALGLMATTESVGLFRVASSTWTMVMIPLTLFNGATSPLLARLHAAGDRRKTQAAVARIALGMTAGVGLFLLPIVINGEGLLTLLFGPGFGKAAPELRVLCVGALLNALFGPNTTLLTMAGRERIVARAFAISVLVLIVLLAVLVPVFGSMGAAISSSVSMVTWNVIIWWDAKVGLNIDTSVLGLAGRYGGVQ